MRLTERERHALEHFEAHSQHAARDIPWPWSLSTRPMVLWRLHHKGLLDRTKGCSSSGRRSYLYSLSKEGINVLTNIEARRLIANRILRRHE